MDASSLTRRTHRRIQEHQACSPIQSQHAPATVHLPPVQLLPIQPAQPVLRLQNYFHVSRARRCQTVQLQAAAGSGSSSAGPRTGAQALAWLDKQAIPVFLITGMAAGAIQPQWGLAASTAGLTKGVTIVIFIISGLQLRRGEAAAALKATGCVIFGLASILLLTPLLGALPLMLLPIQPKALALGTAVFACMPTTLSSGITMTTACGGNVALAILLTVTSNLLSVLTLPLLLPALLGAMLGVESIGQGALSPSQLLSSLVQTVLLPTCAGAAARAYVPGVAQAVDSNKRVIVYLSALCLTSVPWMQVSKALAQGLVVQPQHLALAFGLGSALHLVLLAFNAASCQALGLGGPEPAARAKLRQALVLQASQKTLPVAVAVISSGIGGSFGAEAAGLAAISAVAAHLAQVVIDSMLVPYMTAYVQHAKSPVSSS